MSDGNAARAAFADSRKPRWSEREFDLRAAHEEYCRQSPGDAATRFDAFPKYARRQAMARFLALQDLFRMALDVHGDVVECGVHWGGALMAFAQLSAILEPYNLQRRIVGFDTFGGFPGVTAADGSASFDNPSLRNGGYCADSYDDLLRCIELYDANRPIGHVAKVVLVKGDATRTIPDYMAANPHTVVSLLHLDFDLYEPTRIALEHFLPRMPRGGVIVFDEVNHPAWPGETLAVADAISLANLRLRRFAFEPHISYAVIE